ncbi:MAG: DNA translocase FtsK, partial [Synergistaceae bacterium]|nr:DNA translocase FtsK [Synergistaceae bacterium]
MPAKPDRAAKPPLRNNARKPRARGNFFKKWAEKITGLSEHLAVCLSIAVIILFVVDVFVIASLISDLTGNFGRMLREWMIGGFGGGILIALLFVLYICMSVIFGRRIPHPINQTVGVVLLCFCIMLTLGLMEMPPPIFRPKAGSVLEAGKVGLFMAGWLFTNIGPIGTTLIGMTAISFTLYFFGFTAPFQSAYRCIAEKLSDMFDRRGRHDIPEDDGENAGDESFPDPMEPPEGNEETDETIERSSAWDESDDALDEDGMKLPSPVEVETVDEMDPGNDDVRPGQFPPPFEVYGRADEDNGGVTEEMARPWGERIIASLSQFGVETELADILIGPTVIQFRVQPLPGVKVNKIVALANDLAMALSVASLRVEAPIPGHPFVGIEIPNPKRRGITLRSVIEEDAYQNTDRTLPLPMGVTINGGSLVVGLEDMPHLLVAGTTGSGKSVFVNACIVGLCSMRRPSELKMVLVDPKRVEMAVYEKLPHILTPPVTDPKKAVHVLGWAIREMERRYSLFAMSRVRNLTSYNEMVLPKDRLPNIVIVV